MRIAAYQGNTVFLYFLCDLITFLASCIVLHTSVTYYISLVFSSFMLISESCLSIVECPNGKEGSSDAVFVTGAVTGNKKATNEYDEDEEWVPDEDETKGDRSGKGGGGGGKGPGGRPKSPAKEPTRKKPVVSHEQARERVCVGCLRYLGRNVIGGRQPKARKLNDDSELLNMILPLLNNFPFSALDPRIPYVVCQGCTSNARTHFKNKMYISEHFDKFDTRRKKLVQRRMSFRDFVCPGESCPLCQCVVYELFGAKNVQQAAKPIPNEEKRDDDQSRDDT